MQRMWRVKWPSVMKSARTAPSSSGFGSAQFRASSRFHVEKENSEISGSSGRNARADVVQRLCPLDLKGRWQEVRVDIPRSVARLYEDLAQP